VTAPDPEVVRLAARHLDPEKGVMRSGHVVNAADIAAVTRVLAVASAWLEGRREQARWHWPEPPLVALIRRLADLESMSYLSGPELAELAVLRSTLAESWPEVAAALAAAYRRAAIMTAAEQDGHALARAVSARSPDPGVAGPRPCWYRARVLDDPGEGIHVRAGRIRDAR
jgi:hypothetical protein